MESMSWRPKKRNIRYQDCPDWLPQDIYIEALAAKRFYNEDWEFWVWEEARSANVSMARAEDACIRGLNKALNRVQFVYGPRVAKWYREFLDMGDIFQKVKHPEYINPKLGYSQEHI